MTSVGEVRLDANKTKTWDFNSWGVRMELGGRRLSYAGRAVIRAAPGVDL